MKRGELNREPRWSEVCGTGELACGALRTILKDSKFPVSRVLIGLAFMELHQAPVAFEVC